MRTKVGEIGVYVYLVFYNVCVSLDFESRTFPSLLIFCHIIIFNGCIEIWCDTVFC